MIEILTGNCKEVLSTYGENYFHSCITDPPYGMGMDHWDHSVPDVSIWSEVYRTLRPGAFCLAFCSPELYHRLASNVEDAGFVIKDQIMWMTTTKMAKYNRLKPAHEPIVVGQKPYEGSLKENHEKWGCGLIDIENTRVPWDGKAPTGWIKGGEKRRVFGGIQNKACDIKTREEYWIDPSTNEPIPKETTGGNAAGRYPMNIIGEVNKAEQKYFYAPRATKKEKGVDNDHPTVKPVALMEYLIKIYSPFNSIVLDPFCGSGTTGVAAKKQSRNFVGIDLSEHYTEIARRRMTDAKPVHNSLEVALGGL
jgi:site-specific DNA-methyltransferase (adenine-specific)